jgi:hypothetical protein
LGWVVTEPPKEFEYDWDEPSWVEEAPEWEADWESEEVEEKRETAKPRKKGRKRKGRQSFDFDDGGGFGSDRW